MRVCMSVCMYGGTWLAECVCGWMFVCICMWCVFMHLCMSVCMYVSMYARCRVPIIVYLSAIIVCSPTIDNLWSGQTICICMYGPMYVCNYVCIHVRVCVCIYVIMFAL